MHAPGRRRPIARRHDRHRRQLRQRSAKRSINSTPERGGRIVLVTDPIGAHEAHVESAAKIVLPEMAATVTPLVYAIPVQLLAYHTAVVMGTDVDQPRNLAKSVTVE